MILFRYFAREVFFTMVSVTLIILVISVGWRFSGYLDQAAAGMMKKEVLFVLMVFRLPGFLELILPISFFLAIMLAYGRLHVDQEMTVLQSCGMSPARLAAMTLLMAAAVMIVTGLVSLWLKPLGEQKVEDMLVSQRNLTEFDTLAPGRFQTLSSGKRVTYTRDISSDGDLSDVFINEYVSPGTSAPEAVTVIAESGETQVDELGRRFLVLRDGTRYQGRPGALDFQMIEYEEYGQLVEKDDPSSGKARISAASTRTLMGATDARSVAELQWRISIVLMIPVIALLAIPLAQVKPRQGRFTRLVPAMVLCFLYVLVLSGAKSGLEKENLPLDTGLWWVHGIFGVITLLAYQTDRVLLLFNRSGPRRQSLV